MVLKNILKHKILAVIAIAILIAGGYFLYRSRTKGAATQYRTQAVTKGTITASVSGTGQVAATNQVDVKPSVGGQITSVRVKQGDQVRSGQVIATIDSRTAAAALAQAQASLAQAQAGYEKALTGATGSDLTSAQNAVTNAKQALDDAQANLPTVTAQQNRTVAVALSNMYNAGLSAVPSNTLSTATITLTGTYAGTSEGQYKISLLQTPSGFFYTSNGLGSESGELTRGLSQPLGNGLYMNISTTGTLDPSTIWTIDVPNKASSSYTSAYNSYQSALETRDNAIKQAQDAIPKAQTAYDQAQQALSEKLAPADKATLLSASAAVKQAEANVVSAQTNYSNTTITAPFEGVVAALSAQKGDQASSATALATITTNQKVAEISLNEVDVAKVKIGQKATLTFSAVDGLSVAGEVGQVDLIGTVTQNVVSFKVKIVFDTQDDRIKPGMSATAAIITDIKQDVLIVPSSAVKTNGGQNYVETLVNNAPVQHQVTTGLSNDTDTEVSGDIQEGDEVVTQTITGSQTAATSTQQSRSLLQSIGGGGAGVRTGGGGFGGGGAGR